VRGDRADGWAPQSRAEVMAPHGMVTTSQPLAAQAGLQIMRNGGNAIDAAVATAAMLNLVEPSSTGVAADMFAVIYVAKEKKVYTLNASGIAPSGATLAHLHERHAGSGELESAGRSSGNVSTCSLRTIRNWSARPTVIGTHSRGSNSRLEGAYHRADKAIQNIVDLLAAATQRPPAALQ
jgi:hypothetical protein